MRPRLVDRVAQRGDWEGDREPEPTLGPGELAAALRVPVSTIRRLARAGWLPAVDRRGRWLASELWAEVIADEPPDPYRAGKLRAQLRRQAMGESRVKGPKHRAIHPWKRRGGDAA